MNYDIARRYATAFFALATEQSQVETIAKDMDTLAAMIASDETGFAAFIGNSSYKRTDQTAAIIVLAEKVQLSTLTQKLLGTLSDKRRLPALSEVITQVQSLIAEQKGEVTATVTAAQALDQSQISDIAAKLQKITGKTVRVNLEIDAGIVGGLVVRVGSKLIDSSVRTKLERLHRALKNTNTSTDKTKMKEVA